MKLPDELFVNREGELALDVFHANTRLADVQCDKTRVRVGIYKLVREVEVISEPQIVAEVG
jgi:hypothetical protein